MKSILLFLFAFSAFASFSQSDEIVYLWPDQVPGETGSKKKPEDTGNHARNVLRVTITTPALEVFEPENPNGASVIVSPGGGFNYLAIDIEGYEIAERLNGQGITAFVLHYRTPDNQKGAFQDVQRAIRVVRANAEKWNLDSDKIGVMGFSAGGALSAWAATRAGEESYVPVDALDELSCQPNFALLIYPAYMDQGENRTLSAELTITDETPPMFVFGTADDRLGNGALVITQAMRDAGRPAELHFLTTGGHGYGLREGNVAAETWPKLAEVWLNEFVLE